MKIRSLVCALSVFFVMLVGCSLAFDYPVAKVTIKVIDEGGNPIDAAIAGISFELPKGSGQGIKNVTEKGVTGADGVFSASSRTGTHIAYGAEKQGYYKSYGEYQFSTSSIDRWQPWNPEFKLVLRKIENPVAMYAREFRRELPVIGKSAGFDLMVYDWVAPYGKGINSDITFKLEKQIKSRDEFDSRLEISFLDGFDGFQLVKDDRSYGSDFKLPRFAPYNSYQNKIVLFRKSEIGKSVESSYSKDNNYIFRIRSEEKDGKLIRAMYGKIQGDISFDAMNMATAIVVFKYYLNPDYSNNLEFNINNNLFMDLKSIEKIGLD